MSATIASGARARVLGHVNGLTPRPGAEPSGVPRFGAHRAQWNLIEALRQHDGIELHLTNPLSAGPGLGGSGPDWVHHFGQAFESDPYVLRDRLAPNAAVSSNHHSLSYPHLGKSAVVLANGGDVLVASSESARCVLEDLVAAYIPSWRGRIVTIPLPVFVRAPSVPRRQATRNRLGVSSDEVLLLSLGRLSRHDKATLEPLLSLMADLRVRSPRVRLVVSGDDTYGYSDELLIQARRLGVDDVVSFVIDPPDEERDALFSAADLFVTLFDSAQESFGLAVAEAQAAGLPCVCPGFGPIEEVVKDGVTGFTVPTRFVDIGSRLDAWRRELSWRCEHQRFSQLVWVDRRALFDAVLTLVEKASLRRDMGERALRHADRFDPRRVANHYFELWSSGHRSGDRRRVQRPFEPSRTFGRFASTRVSPDFGWCGREGLEPQDLIAQELLDDLGVAADFGQVVEVIRHGGGRLSAADAASRAGITEESALVALAVLGKYGFVEGAVA